MPCHPDRVRRNAEPPAFPEDPRAPNVAPKVDALVESLSGWFDGYYFDPRKFQHEDIVYVHPGRLGVITSIGCPPPLSADDAFWHASTDTPYPPPWYTPPSSRDSDPCVETVDDFLISYIKSDPKTWAPQNPHYVKNHESAPGTVRQWFRAMRAADFARAVDLEIDYTREGHIYGEVAWKHREPWTLFDTQAVVDRETAAHYARYPWIAELALEHLRRDIIRSHYRVFLDQLLAVEAPAHVRLAPWLQHAPHCAMPMAAENCDCGLNDVLRDLRGEP